MICPQNQEVTDAGPAPAADDLFAAWQSDKGMTCATQVSFVVHHFLQLWAHHSLLLNLREFLVPQRALDIA